MTTLQALSAIGSYAPDAPGRLVADRDPPGFEVLAGAAVPAAGHAAAPGLSLVRDSGRTAAPQAKAKPEVAAQPGAEPGPPSRAEKAAARFKAVEAGRAETERIARAREAERAAARAAAARAAREREAARARAEADACARQVAQLQDQLRRAEEELAEAEARAERTAAAVDGEGDPAGDASELHADDSSGQP
jgi:colicin import membrane protein